MVCSSAVEDVFMTILFARKTILAMSFPQKPFAAMPITGGNHRTQGKKSINDI